MIFVGVFIAILDIFLQSYFRAQNFGMLNRGVSFGLAPEIGYIVSLSAFSFFIVWYFYDKFFLKKSSRFIFLVALGGGVNILCRFFWGSIWDYFCFSFLPFCFNLSDVLIGLGVVSYILGVDGNRGTLRRQRNSGN